MPALNEHKQNSLKKLRKKQSNKLNKNKLIAKTEAFQSKAKFFPFKNTYLKIRSKPIFVSTIGPVVYLQDLKKNHWPLKID